METAQNIGLPASYMKQLGRLDEGIQLSDGNYYGSLMVFHHLHCLVSLIHLLCQLRKTHLTQLEKPLPQLVPRVLRLFWTTTRRAEDTDISSGPLPSPSPAGCHVPSGHHRGDHAVG